MRKELTVLLENWNNASDEYGNDKTLIKEPNPTLPGEYLITLKRNFKLTIQSANVKCEVTHGPILTLAQGQDPMVLLAADIEQMKIAFMKVKKKLAKEINDKVEVFHHAAMKLIGLL